MWPQVAPRGAPTAPPPGLGMDQHVPMKIPLRVNTADALGFGAAPSHGVPYAAPPPAEALAYLAAQMPGAAHEPRGARPAYLLEESSSSGEWVNTVLATAPHLTAAGLKEALMIFDRGIENLQQAKALDKMIASTCAAGGVFMQMPHLVTARTMRAQISRQQQVLLCQLRHLRATKPAGSGSPVPSSGQDSRKKNTA